MENILIVVSLLGGGVAIFFYKNKPSKKGKVIKVEQKTANKFVNVKDIKDRYLYTSDGHIIMYIKINPISIELFSEREKIHLNSRAIQ